MAHSMRSRCTDPSSTVTAEGARIPAVIHPARGIPWSAVTGASIFAVAAEYDRRVGRPRERGHMVETEQDKKAPATRYTDSKKVKALVELRKAIWNALRLGISPEHLRQELEAIVAYYLDHDRDI